MIDFVSTRPVQCEDHVGQFILTRAPGSIPSGWAQHQKDGWYIGANRLPVLPVSDKSGQHCGYCLGYPVGQDELLTEAVTLPCQTGTVTEPGVIESFYRTTGGKFVLIILQGDEQKVFLDPYGSLSTVFSITNETVASTLTLIPGDREWDRDTITALSMPDSGLWFPSGLTACRDVGRLLPNHCLDLKNWSVGRHWPKSPSDLAVENDTEYGVAAISRSLKGTIGAVARKYPLQMSLTAGRDVRMLLACARNELSRMTFVTISDNSTSVDDRVAARLAKRFSLEYRRIPVWAASHEALRHWLAVTGFAVSGDIWKMHKTLQAFDKRRVMLTGIAGEVGRAFYWRPGDTEESILSAVELLKRAQLPANDAILRATEAWLANLAGYNAFQVLDLFYLEQRLGCWAGPQQYGNTTSAFELSPFNHRVVFTAMMKLQHDYRRDQRLSEDISRVNWPELLDYPFNQYTLRDKLACRLLALSNRMFAGFKGIIGMVKTK